MGKIIDTKIIFGITAERRETILNHGWLGWARIKEKAEKRGAMLGQAKLALCFQNPFTSELEWDSETTSLILLRK